MLLDDNFASIVAAIEEGRGVFDNIRKFTTYVLTSNVPELVPYLAFVLLRIPSLDHLHHRLGPLGFLDRCRPLRADFFERVGDGLSDTAVVVSGDRRDLDSLFVVRHRS